MHERSALLCCGHGKRRYSVRRTLSRLLQTLVPFSRSSAGLSVGQGLYYRSPPHEHRWQDARAALRRRRFGQGGRQHLLHCSAIQNPPGGFTRSVRRRRPPHAHTGTIDDLLFGTKNSFSQTLAQCISLPFCDAAIAEIRVLVGALESGRKMKGAFWTNVIRNSCLEWVLSKETLELIEREGYQYTTRDTNVESPHVHVGDGARLQVDTGPIAGQRE